MQLNFENICGFKSASVKIDGITVIAGKNNTGKSTIGKVLFLLFNSLYNLRETIESYRINAIEEILDDMFNDFFFYTNTEEIARDIIATQREYQKDINQLTTYLQKACHQSIVWNQNDEKEHAKHLELLEKFNFNDISKKIDEIFHISDDDYKNQILNRNVDIIFREVLSHARMKNELSHILLTIKDKVLNFKVKDSEFIDAENTMSFYTEAVYIDNPFVLDTMDSAQFFLQFTNTKRNVFSRSFFSGIQKYLLKALIKEKQENPTSEILMKKNLEKIFTKMKSINLGELITSNQGYQYRFDGDIELPVSNISTGLKVLLIIKILLNNGSIQENGTLILDEPEIHLHPEWQLLFAEIIVLLQKQFSLHILLTTHSPYFLKAIETYSQLHETQEKCRYYMTDCVNSICTIQDVTDNTQIIYEKFSDPFEKLERLC